MADCTIHLIALRPDASLPPLVSQVATESSILIRGRPYGWVHPPRSLNENELTKNNWDLFLLTEGPNKKITSLQNAEVVSVHISVGVSISNTQLTGLRSRLGSRPKASANTPPLPADWSHGAVPTTAIEQARGTVLQSGELRLDNDMAQFLSAALPKQIVQEPVYFFNFFKYPDGDRTVHDAYMQGFKDNFGSAAGADVLFMGSVTEPLSYSGARQSEGDDGRSWDDANLVQYDSVWHYAYMLSTDVYKKLNRQKVEGLEDTCILLVGELDL